MFGQIVATPPLATEVFYVPMETTKRSQLFISYSPKDELWLKRLQVHLRPLEKRGIVDRWDVTKIKAGQNREEEIKKALERAKVAILLVSPDFLASDFIAEKEIPALLSAQEREGLVIMPMLLSPSLFSETPFLSQFATINPPSQTLIELPASEQEKYWLILVREIWRVIDPATGDILSPLEKPKEGEIGGKDARDRRKATLKNEPFWQFQIGRSKYHNGGKNADHTCLLVLVHGLYNTNQRDWNLLPQWLVETIGHDFNILSYQFNCGVFHKSSIGNAAAELRKTIAETLDSHMHLFFVTHGIGGLVVEEAVSQDQEAVAVELQPSSIPTIAGRAREIIHLGFPQQKAKQASDFILNFLAGFSKGASYLWALIRFLGIDFPSFGRNKIFSELQLRSPYINDLQIRFQDAVSLLTEIGLPRPRITLLAENRELVTRWEPGLCEVIMEFSHHQLKKNPSSAVDPRVFMIANRIRPYIDAPSMAIAYTTVRRARLLDADIALVTGQKKQQPLYTSLLGASTLSDSLLADRAGSQFAVYKSLLEEIIQGRSSPKNFVLTGGAGVGKSVLLRAIGRAICVKHLESRGSNPVCILMPMQQVTFSPAELEDVKKDKIGVIGMEVIFSYWSRFAHLVIADETEERTCTPLEVTRVKVDPWVGISQKIHSAYLKRELALGNTIIVFDGVDEWLTNYPVIGVDYLKILQRWIERESNGRTMTLMGIRATLPNIKTLAPGTNIFEVLPLTEEDAENLFAGTTSLLNKIADPHLKQLILTPLVLGRLGPVIDSLYLMEFHSRMSILRRALRAIISSAGLPSLETGPGTNIDVNTWIDALSILAWILYRENQFVMQDIEVVSHVNLLRKLWIENAAPCASTDDVNQAFAILLDDRSRQAIRIRTVLSAVGPSGIRFLHREWMDLLVAHYLTRAIHSRNAYELQYRAFNKKIYRDASYLLSYLLLELQEEANNQWFVQMYGDSLVHAPPIALSNIVSTLGNGPVPLDSLCFRYLSLEALKDAYPELPRLTFISSFCMRLLRHEKEDKDWDNLLKESVQALAKFASPGVAIKARVSASMAWCYANLLQRRFGINMRVGQVEWPTLDPRTEEGIAIVRKSEIMWTTRPDGTTHTSMQQRTFQVACAHYTLAVRNYPDEEISLIHYLFLVCATLKAGNIHSDAYPLINEVFNISEDLAKRVNTFELPEARQVFESCLEILRANFYLPTDVF